MRWGSKRRRSKGNSASSRRVFYSFFQIIQRAREEMIAGLYKFEALGVGEPLERRFKFLLRAEFVHRALEKVFRNCASGEIIEFAGSRGKSHGQQPGRRRSSNRTTQLQDHARAEGKSRQRPREIGIPFAQKSQR